MGCVGGAFIILGLPPGERVGMKAASWGPPESSIASEVNDELVQRHGSGGKCGAQRSGYLFCIPRLPFPRGTEHTEKGSILIT